MPDLTPLSQAFKGAQNVVVFIHPQATFDAVAAATAWCLAIREQNKSCTIACEAPMRPEYSRLTGIQSVSQEVGNRDLVISFAYDENQVDKVSYNVDEATQRFELVVSPKSGHQPLDPQTVEYKQSGLSADVVVLLGFHSFEELGEFYQKERYAIEKAFTVAVTQSKVPAFAKLHVALQPEQLSYSEWTYFALRQLQAKAKDEVATNLLAGIEYATDRFQNAAQARTFETLANLMKTGGQRMPDNPALQFPATPIREPQGSRPAYGPQPAGMNVPQWSGPTGTVPVVAGGQAFPPQPAPQHQSPSEFAQAMGGRS